MAPPSGFLPLFPDGREFSVRSSGFWAFFPDGYYLLRAERGKI